MLSRKLQYHGEPHRNLGRRHGYDKEEHHLTVHLPPARARGNEREPAGVQHDLDAHQREDQVTPREKTGQPQQKQQTRY